MAETDNSVLYSVGCDCGSDEHVVSMDVEYDREFECVCLRFYGNYHYCNQSLWQRFKDSLRILFTGWLVLDAELLMLKWEHVNSLLGALCDAENKLQDAEFDRQEAIAQ